MNARRLVVIPPSDEVAFTKVTSSRRDFSCARNLAFVKAMTQVALMGTIARCAWGGSFELGQSCALGYPEHPQWGLAGSPNSLGRGRMNTIASKVAAGRTMEDTQHAKEEMLGGTHPHGTLAREEHRHES